LPVDTSIIDAKSKQHVQVARNQSLTTNQVEPDLPPIGTKNVFRYFTQKLADEAGLTNMNVDGSTTPQEFFIKAVQDSDIHILAVIVVIADSLIAHNNFGNIFPLTNGWDLIVTESGEETPLIEKAKTGGEVIIQSGAFWPYGTGVDTWELSNFTGVSDAQLINLPVGQIIPGGIRLGRGTIDKVTSIVNDDLTGLINFEVRVIGYRHFRFLRPTAGEIE